MCLSFPFKFNHQGRRPEFIFFFFFFQSKAMSKTSTQRPLPKPDSSSFLSPSLLMIE